MESLARRYDAIKPHLTERQRRVWLGSEARELGSSRVGLVADAVQVSPDTVRRGRTEFDDPTSLPVGRSRSPGGGRRRVEEHDPDLSAALDKLIDPDSRGEIPSTPAQQRRAAVDAAVEQAFTASGASYGSPRIHVDLVADGWMISVNTVAESMPPTKVWSLA